MLRFLLDTCFISDLFKPQSPPSLRQWAESHPIGESALSAMTIGELRRGVEMLPRGRRRDVLWDWLEHGVGDQFSGRILPVDATVARAWGVLSARARAIHRTLPVVDAIILATAEVHHLTVVTRNVRDFEGYGVAIANPWEADTAGE